MITGETAKIKTKQQNKTKNPNTSVGWKKDLPMSKRKIVVPSKTGLKKIS